MWKDSFTHNVSHIHCPVGFTYVLSGQRVWNTLYLTFWRLRIIDNLGDTEDDLDTKKDTRPKRSRPSAASTAADSSHVTRPSSAASVTSTASARDLETRLGGSGQTTAGGQHDEELDGKHSPDSQKSNDEKR